MRSDINTQSMPEAIDGNLRKAEVISAFQDQREGNSAKRYDFPKSNLGLGNFFWWSMSGARRRSSAFKYDQEIENLLG